MIQIVITVTGLLAAAFFDWNSRRIPNSVTFTMIVLGLIVNFMDRGAFGISTSLAGLGLGLLLLVIPFAAGGVGAGDVKLLAAVGSLLGPDFALKAFLASAVFGGLFSIIVAVRQKTLGKTFQGVKDRILYLILTRKVPQEERGDTMKPLGIPYAFAIGFGTLCTLFLFWKGG